MAWVKLNADVMLKFASKVPFVPIERVENVTEVEGDVVENVTVIVGIVSILFHISLYSLGKFTIIPICDWLLTVKIVLVAVVTFIL